MAIGAVATGLSEANVTSGFTACSIDPLVNGAIIHLEAHEAIAIHQPFTGAALGRIKNITDNATDVAQFAYGTVLEAATAQGDIIPCLINKSENYEK